MEPRTKRKAVSGVHRQVRAELKQSGLAPGKSLVVAVSGGPDSMALLFALHRLRDELDLNLHGAHLNHELRGDSSDSDAEFVAESFRRLDIPLTLVGSDVGSYRRQRRLSLEQAARQVRYDFLARVVAEQHADAVALGHTADDQAETVLMHVLRGSGLAGLRGMETSSRHRMNGQETVLARPLLQVSREETVEYCRAVGVRPRLDESNLSLEPRRNWVRMELLPLLQRFNPAVKEALVRLSRSTARDLSHMEREIDGVWRETVRNEDGGVAVNRRAFSLLDPAVQGHLLRRAVGEVKGGLGDVEQSHIDGMAALMVGASGRSLDLPGGIRFIVGYNEASLTRSDDRHCPLPTLDGERTLNIPGQSLLPGWRVTANLTQHGSGPEGRPMGDARGPQTETEGAKTPGVGRSTLEQSPGRHAATFDYDALTGRVIVRSRRPGDRFQPLGMSQSKKLQDFMVDAKIPRRWRDSVPLVVTPRGIAWVLGWRIAEWARVQEATARQLELRFVARQ